MMNRIDAKAKAKSLLRGKPFSECLVFFLILLGLSALPAVLQWRFSPLRLMLWGILDGDLWWVINEIIETSGSLTIPACIGVIQALAGVLFSAGLIRCALRLCRGDQTVRAVDTLQAIDKVWKYILISLFQKLLLVLWNLPAVVLTAAAWFALVKGLYNESAWTVVGIALLLAAVLWSVFISINKTLQYFFSYYVCEDNPELGVVACVRKSGQLTAGHKLELLTTHLSFIGWNLLDITFVSQIFTIPYRYLTYAGVYRQLDGVEEDRQQYAARPVVDGVQPTEPAAGGCPAIEFISGEYAGTQVPAADGGEIRIGRDPRQVHIVLSQNNGRISGLHCGVRYDSASDSYFVTDYSTNGTYAEGVRLPAGSTSVRRGTIIKLADGEVLCRLA